MDMFTLYLIVKLDSIIILCGVVLSVALLILFCYILYNAIEGNKFKKSVVIPWSVIAVLNLFAVTLIPSTKQTAFIYLTSKASTWIVNNEQLQKMPDNAFKVLNKAMESYINETLVDTKKEVTNRVREEVTNKVKEEVTK